MKLPIARPSAFTQSPGSGAPPSVSAADTRPSAYPAQHGGGSVQRRRAAVMAAQLPVGLQRGRCLGRLKKSPINLPVQRDQHVTYE